MPDRPRPRPPSAIDSDVALVLGLFDSGLGGLTVLRNLRARLPRADLFFFADQAHAPYGDRRPDDLVRLMHGNLTWLDELGVDGIVMACNTSCAMGESYGWPPLSVPVIDLIESAALAVESAGVGRVGIVATTATVRSSAYPRRINARVPTAHIVQIAAPKLVPLVEAGMLHGEEPRSAVQEVCAQLPNDVEAIVLACTHYPLLDEHFEAALGPRILRLDPATLQAERAAELLGDCAGGNGAAECVTNGDLAVFRSRLAELVPEIPAQARHVDEVRYLARISNASAAPEI